jgi:hypothetical protein
MLMFLSNIKYKIKRRTWSRFVSKIRDKTFYPKIYKSYWHARFHTPGQPVSPVNYYTAVPNSGAGIGHQLANWIAGFWYARQFGLQFAHTPFVQEKWEYFLGFGEGEVAAEVLIKKHGYKKILLPLFDEFNIDEIAVIRKIVHSYSDRKVVFVSEQDQFYRDQFGVMDDIRRKFHHAKARKEDHLIYDKDFFNIAVHVRRGDVVNKQKTDNPNLLMRWQDAGYFERVLSTVIETIKPDKPIAIYLFSQGDRSAFSEFEKFDNMHFCMEMSPVDSFLHMVNADLLITSKSSFSYKPALLSNGIKICPKNFWHGYSNAPDWILVDDDGCFDSKQLIMN